MWWAWRPSVNSRATAWAATARRSPPARMTNCPLAPARPVGTILRGTVVDQAALHGVINRLQGLGLELVEVRSNIEKLRDRVAKARASQGVTAPNAEARAAHTQLGFDVADSNADGTAAIPFPSVFVIDEDGTVRFADVHVDYTTRTEVATVLEAVDALRVGTTR